MVKVEIFKIVFLLIAGVKFCYASSSKPSNNDSQSGCEDPVKSTSEIKFDVTDVNFFRLEMTVIEMWNDDYMNKSSRSFNILATNLGVDLIDLVNNANQWTDENNTNFRLVEVRPVRGTASKVFVEFIVSSKKWLNLKNLHETIYNCIARFGGIYRNHVTVDEFSLELITKEEAEIEINKQ